VTTQKQEVKPKISPRVLHPHPIRNLELPEKVPVAQHMKSRRETMTVATRKMTENEA
jgi:hypothetical protein